MILEAFADAADGPGLVMALDDLAIDHRLRDEAVVDLDVLGFSGMELDRLLAAADAGLGDDAEDVPPPPVVPVTRTGDVWRCGEHRLLCGDATKLTDVQRALGAGCLADMGFLDPPYNVAYEGGTAAKMTIANDALGGGFLDFLRPALANVLQVTKHSRRGEYAA